MAPRTLKAYGPRWSNLSKVDDSTECSFIHELGTTTSSLPGRYFIMKSFSEFNLYQSIKSSLWSSPHSINQLLNEAYLLANSEYPIYLFFSLCHSSHFIGFAEMTSKLCEMNYQLWEKNNKFKNYFNVKWHVIKDIPNYQIRNWKGGEEEDCIRVRNGTEINTKTGEWLKGIMLWYPIRTHLNMDGEYYQEKENEMIIKRGLENGIYFIEVVKQESI